ncbi:protein of unknown function DUF1656 [Methylocella silvestris BL2]|uniref:DUF1656 domain-containing protein n=1 Tax=Methylocella silvestris (strain DSM 15510 / CIP 108128 / LMG 27833 / NCIMB 13906 / BL2) TaxID=395965 RepID=B8ES29_METSB|nr:DUF1656 domain-containing protein [Methylocella silvestris]ACK52244.1 protein of unknown function DUF1656 [Methylocella silvestris BL2]
MMQEVDIYGIFVPALALWMFGALALSVLLRRILALCGAHKLLWHPPLFEFSAFVTILGALTLLHLE